MQSPFPVRITHSEYSKSVFIHEILCNFVNPSDHIRNVDTIYSINSSLIWITWYKVLMSAIANTLFLVFCIRIRHISHPNSLHIRYENPLLYFSRNKKMLNCKVRQKAYQFIEYTLSNRAIS